MGKEGDGKKERDGWEGGKEGEEEEGDRQRGIPRAPSTQGDSSLQRGTKSGSIAAYKAVVGAERANRRSNLFAQRSGASDANGYSSRSEKKRTGLFFVLVALAGVFNVT
ncbi:hypothetical protein G5I_03209 [Acromyrmex echinatior]|uniref:Uncharacterized protein n=1 Tax=Acromyrmex echinatior TaxID=103372 RepID=F4WCD5_ACREC|nr:hypothetical protein G5I_03209 [Acromyrmex echinatior]